MFINFLSYGGIGLGLALALLTYRIIANEQKKSNPNINIIFLTYGFMILAITMAGFGFISEIKKSDNLKEENEKIVFQNALLQAKLERLKENNDKFEKMKHSLDMLLDVKGSLIKKSDTISNIKSELIIIQETMKKELN